MFVLLDEEAPPIGDLDIEITLNSLSVIFPFSECEFTKRLCSIECYLTPKTGVIEEGCDYCDFHEFGFQFVVTSDWGLYPVSATMDRNEAAQFIPEGARGLVLDIVQAAMIRLLNYKEPDYLYRVAYTPHLPEKAQKKHALITYTAELAGYALVHEGTDPCGRRFWFMARKSVALTA